jgi:hypothetical protein
MEKENFPIELFQSQTPKHIYMTNIISSLFQQARKLEKERWIVILTLQSSKERLIFHKPEYLFNRRRIYNQILYLNSFHIYMEKKRFIAQYYSTSHLDGKNYISRKIFLKSTKTQDGERKFSNWIVSEHFFFLSNAKHIYFTNIISSLFLKARIWRKNVELLFWLSKSQKKD